MQSRQQQGAPIRSLVLPTLVLVVVLLGLVVWQSSSDHVFQNRLTDHEDQLQKTDAKLQTHQTSIESNREAVELEEQVNSEQQVTIEALQRDLMRLETQLSASKKLDQKQHAEIETQLQELPQLRDRLDRLQLLREDDRAGLQELREQLDQLLEERGTTAKRLDAIERKLGLVPAP